MKIIKKTKLESSDLPDIYKKFCNDLPKEGIRVGLTPAGDQLVMYGYQYHINVLNEVVGLDHWLAEELEGHTTVEKIGIRYLATIKVRLNLGNWEDGKFTPIVSRSVYGSGIHDETRANALKGAFTNGFKKAAAMYGIGKREYEGFAEDFEMTTDKKQKIKKIDVNTLTTEDLEKTKAIEQLLMNVRTKNDLDNAKKVYDKMKSKLTAKEIKYLETLFEKVERKIKK